MEVRLRVKSDVSDKNKNFKIVPPCTADTMDAMDAITSLECDVFEATEHDCRSISLKGCYRLRVPTYNSLRKTSR